ncbi:MAG: phosphate acyltransferase PlsX [Actinomycetota bacterium]|nr:phosphate acyltransferase PlsX [Actinomycetota bacterium]
MARPDRPEGAAFAALPVAVDAMGGDRAPGEIVAGARRARDERGIDVVLVGRPGEMGDTGGLPEIHASEVIGMEDDPAQGVRRKKDSSLVRAAEAVRDGRALAMVSAGNTGAAMASALLRMGRLPGVVRPAIATPIPNPGSDRPPTVLLDSGANAECSPQMLVQFAQMGAVFARCRYGTSRPQVALLSIGEEKSKGTPLVKEAHAMLASGVGGTGLEFTGNVEGRDFFHGVVDVVVTDGFTGNVALKTMEGSMGFLVAELGAVLGRDDVREAATQLLPHLLPLASALDPEGTGGAMLLGVDGVCVISHGSSSATAMVNAITVAHDLAVSGLVRDVAAAVVADHHPTDPIAADRTSGR